MSDEHAYVPGHCDRCRRIDDLRTPSLPQRISREAVNLDESDASRIEFTDEAGRRRMEELVEASEQFKHFRFGVLSDGEIVVSTEGSSLRASVDGDSLVITLVSDDPKKTAKELNVDEGYVKSPWSDD